MRPHPAPLVSVCIPTYNHAQFLGQALDSVLMQVAPFEVEVLVGDDCSTDGTQAVLAKYAARFSGVVHPIARDRNLGTGPNMAGLMNLATGKYIAVLEGDDYWTHSEKLASLVAFLEASPDYTVAYHNAKEVHEEGAFPSHEYCGANQPLVSTLEDLLDRNFIPTCSVVYRNGVVGEFPAWRGEISSKYMMGDWTLHILYAQHGKIRYFPGVWGVHRHHAGGVWTSRPQRYAIEAMADALRIMRPHLPPGHDKSCLRSMSRYLFLAGDLAAREGEVRHATALTLRGLQRAAASGQLLARRTVSSVARFPARLARGFVRR